MSSNDLSVRHVAKRCRVAIDSQGLLFDDDDLFHWLSSVEQALLTERRCSPMQLRYSEELPKVRKRVDRGLNMIRQGLESLDASKLKQRECVLEEKQTQFDELQAQLELVRADRDASKRKWTSSGKS